MRSSYDAVHAAPDHSGDADPVPAKAGFRLLPPAPIADASVPIPAALDRLGLDPAMSTEAIDLDAVADRLRATSWFRLVLRDGPVDPCEALQELGRFRVLGPTCGAPQFRRVVLGLVPMLVDPATGWLVSMLGRASWRARGADLEAVLRLFWWTVEAGVGGRPGALEPWGAAFRDAGAVPEFGGLCLEPWSPEAVAAATRGPLVAGGPAFVVGEPARAAVELRRWLVARGLLGGGV